MVLAHYENKKGRNKEGGNLSLTFIQCCQLLPYTYSLFCSVFILLNSISFAGFCIFFSTNLFFDSLTLNPSRRNASAIAHVLIPTSKFSRYRF